MKAIDLKGQRFGKLTAVESLPIRAKGGFIRWKCNCDCGGIAEATSSSLRQGNVRSCGCLHREVARVSSLVLVKDLTGQKFGMLAVIKKVPSDKPGAHWLCRCDCGNEKVVRGAKMSAGQVGSCGCATKNRLVVRSAKFRAWNAKWAALRRATNPKVKLNDRISVGIYYSLRNRNSRKMASWQKLVGYTTEQLYNHLTTTMPVGGSWNDFILGRLEIDHRRPLSSFDYVNADDASFKTAWSLDNLQLLTADSNRKKNDRWEHDLFPECVIVKNRKGRRAGNAAE